MGEGMRAWLGATRAAAAVAVAVAVLGLVVAAFTAAEAVSASRADEVAALLEIRAALRDPSDALRGWTGAGAGGSPCRWKSVTCSRGHVHGLELRNLNLSGELSPAIGKLRRLRNVFFDKNDISGPVPDSIAHLPLLKRLDLSHNRLNGTIPGTLGDLSNLQLVNLSSNNLSGSIPESLATSHSLIILDLSYNNLSSAAPVFAFGNVLLDGNPALRYDGRGGRYHSTTADEALPPLALPVENTPSENPRGTFATTSRLVIFCVSIGILAMLLFAGVCLVSWRRRRQCRPQMCDDMEENTVPQVFRHVKMYKLKDIQRATGNFNRNNILGQGGFGVVFKGILDDKIVAVKRLKNLSSHSGDAQFNTEVEVISMVAHRHLLHLIGFCSQEEERILVYPYMANGTVSSKLQEYVCGRAALDWARRKKIAMGTARGLIYLHGSCRPGIVHCDIKASNILLDDRLEAVVADFGLAKLLDHHKSHALSVVGGTFGRIPPEFLISGHSSEKTDVFGFGFLLVELITGRRSFILREDEYADGGITDWARELLERKQLSTLVDKKLRGNYDAGELEEMVQIALLCTRFCAAHRPTMPEVLRMLEGDGTAATRWDAVKNIATPKFRTPVGAGAMSPTAGYGDEEYESVELEAVELSGPR